MSTASYAASFKVRAVTVGTAAVLVGSNVDGSANAKRLIWNGTYLDDGTGNFNVSISDTQNGDYYPLQAGVEKKKPLGPGAQIWALASKTGTLFVDEEISS